MNEVTSNTNTQMIEVQKEISGIRETLVALQKDVDHIGMKLDAYLLVSKEELRELKIKVHDLEVKVVYMSSAAATIATIISLLIKYINF